MTFQAMRNRATRLVLLLALGAAGTAGAADRLRVEAIRISPDASGTRVDLPLSRRGDFKLFTLTGPHRVVLDVTQAALGPTALPLPSAAADVTGLRVAHRPGGHLRIVFDVSRPLVPVAAVTDRAGRPVLSLRLKVPGAASPPVAASPAAASATPPPLPPPLPPAPAASVPRPAAPLATARPTRDVVVVVDAGHGGRDPGAVGPSGLLEKDVTLAISRRLVNLLEAEPAMRGVLTRNRDEFLVLRQRMEKARGANADLFISIHADAAHNRRARGSTVYVLSEKGASDEAALRLARRENAALIGGVELGDKEPVLAQVLLDLSQNAAISSSIQVGESILGQMKHLGHLHRSTVQMAPFMVLKSPDVPSILVETAYISNPEDERNLKTPAYQDRLARAILAGVREYFSRNPPRGTILASAHPRGGSPLEYVIQRGDTLSAIASRYRVSVQELRAANRLRGDRLLAGQTLTIPGDDT